MSKLDVLLQKLCPDGVEFLKLGDSCKIKTGKLNANAMKEDGQYAFFTCDKNQYKIDTYSFDTEAILISGNGSQVGHINYYKGKFDAYQRTYVLSDFLHLDTLFLYYYLKSKLKDYILKFAKNGSVPYITLPMLQNFDIPVPPLEMQREIVRIMDNFTELTAELTAELSARRKQYEYYLEQFYGVDLDNLKQLEEQGYCKLLRLSDIGTLQRGKRFVKADTVESGIPCIHYGELYTWYGVATTNIKSHVKENLKQKLRYAEKGDIVIVGAGENDYDIGVGVVLEGEEKVAIHDACYTLKHNLVPRYISYYLRTQLYHNQIKKYVCTGKICAISAEGIGKAIIPVPSIVEQERIVSILDRFDTLCNDLTSGLPAEIEARQKQYEYYRDKLLDFKRAK